MALAPYLWLCFGIFICTLASGFRLGLCASKSALLLGLVPFALWQMNFVGTPSVQLFGSAMQVDALTRIIGAAAATFAALTALYASRSSDGGHHPEWTVMLLTGVLGMGLLPGARDLVSFFVFLETLALSGYMLTAFDSSRERGLEAGLKYLLLGAFGSAVFLMGATLIYGAVGSFDYEMIAGASSKLSGQAAYLFAAGAFLIVTSLLLKAAIVPFHMWAPDVYQAAPTAFAAFLASATKMVVLGSSAYMVNRLGILNLAGMHDYVQLLAILSIVVGSMMALAQTSLRRLFAYSGIVNAGYAVLAWSMGTVATGSMLTSLIIYGVTLICLFAVTSEFMNNLGLAVNMDLDVRDLGAASRRSSPFLSFLFVLCLFSIAGIPPLPGFFGKYLILKDLWMNGNQLGTFAVLLGTLLGLAYYLRLIVPIYLESPKTKSEPVQKLRLSPAFAATVSIALAFVLLGGLSRLPSWIQSVEGLAR
jgi:proton-translocating NADH-quinone oxidoreductase chain N